MAFDVSTLPQTLPSLIGLLRRQGRDAPVLTAVATAHELIVEILSGQYRPSGKPFSCHLVGTAGALAFAGADDTTMLAGMLHAAYINGEWGDGTRAATARKRQLLSARLGAAVAERVARYGAMPWDHESIGNLRSAQLAGSERDVVMIRLANEVDDHLDNGILYGHSASNRRALSWQMLPHWMRLARELGHPVLAEMLDATVGPVVRGAIVPVALRTEHWSSYMVAPLSHRPRPKPRSVDVRWARSATLRYVSTRLRKLLAGGAR